MVHVGCCGWNVKGGRRAYFDAFNLIELQYTFYRLPRISTVNGWRNEAPKDFEFTVKAWQIITHTSESPTWHKASSHLKIPLERAHNYGHLKPTRENFEAFKKTKKICEVLKAKICIIQTPPSFKYTNENMKNAKEFFSEIDRENLTIAWEPRGDWNDNLDPVKKLCNSLNLVHVVDILRRSAVSEHKISYTRLHGLGKREPNYRYKYTDKDLEILRSKVEALEEVGHEVYVLFNNVYMTEDAKHFLSYARKP